MKCFERKVHFKLNVKFRLPVSRTEDANYKQGKLNDCTCGLYSSVFASPWNPSPAWHTQKKVTLNIVCNNWTKKWFCMPVSPNYPMCSHTLSVSVKNLPSSCHRWTTELWMGVSQMHTCCPWEVLHGRRPETAPSIALTLNHAGWVYEWMMWDQMWDKMSCVS